MIINQLKHTPLLLLSLLINGTQAADDFVAEDVFETQADIFILASGNDASDVTLQFGDSLNESLRWDAAGAKFVLSGSLDIENNQLINARLENAASAPTCDGSVIGKIYFNTTTGSTFSCDGTSWEQLDATGGMTIDSVEQTTDYDSLGVNTINVLSATAANRPADSQFIVKTLGDSLLKTQLASSGSTRYYRTYQATVWSGWTAIKTSRYAGYAVQDWDQTDGTGSYIGRTRTSDSKWLITLSVPGGFTYAQEENNSGTTNFATAWTNRLTLTYGSSFTP